MARFSEMETAGEMGLSEACVRDTLNMAPDQTPADTPSAKCFLRSSPRLTETRGADK
jgi:hypothetical protein